MYNQQIVWTHPQSVVPLVYVSELRMSAGMVSEDRNKGCVRTIAKRMTVDGSADMLSGTLNTQNIQEWDQIDTWSGDTQKREGTTTKLIGISFSPTFASSSACWVKSACPFRRVMKTSALRWKTPVQTCFFFASSLESRTSASPETTTQLKKRRTSALSFHLVP